MPGIEFNEVPQYVSRTTPTQTTGLTALVVRWGFAKDETQAGYVLLGVAIAALALTVAIWFLSGSHGSPNAPAPFRAPAP